MAANWLRPPPFALTAKIKKHSKPPPNFTSPTYSSATASRVPHNTAVTTTKHPQLVVHHVHNQRPTPHIINHHNALPNSSPATPVLRAPAREKQHIKKTASSPLHPHHHCRRHANTQKYTSRVLATRSNKARCSLAPLSRAPTQALRHQRARQQRMRNCQNSRLQSCSLPPNRPAPRRVRPCACQSTVPLGCALRLVSSNAHGSTRTNSFCITQSCTSTPPPPPLSSHAHTNTQTHTCIPRSQHPQCHCLCALHQTHTLLSPSTLKQFAHSITHPPTLSHALPPIKGLTHPHPLQPPSPPLHPHSYPSNSNQLTPNQLILSTCIPFSSQP